MNKESVEYRVLQNLLSFGMKVEKEVKKGLKKKKNFKITQVQWGIMLGKSEDHGDRWVRDHQKKTFENTFEKLRTTIKKKVDQRKKIHKFHGDVNGFLYNRQVRKDEGWTWKLSQESKKDLLIRYFFYINQGFDVTPLFEEYGKDQTYMDKIINEYNDKGF